MTENYLLNSVQQIQETYGILDYNDIEGHLKLMSKMLDVMTYMACRIESLEKQLKQTSNEVGAAYNGMTYP